MKNNYIYIFFLAALLSGCAVTGKVRIGPAVTAPDPLGDYYTWHGPVREVVVTSYEQKRDDGKLGRKCKESDLYTYRFNRAGQITEITRFSFGKYYGGRQWDYDSLGRIELYRDLLSDSTEYIRREFRYKTQAENGKSVPYMPPVEHIDDNQNIVRDSLGRPSVITMNDKWGHKQKVTTNRYGAQDRPSQLLGSTVETFKGDEWATRNIFTYDGYGRPASKEQWGRSEDGRPWAWVYRYEYDFLGNKTVQEVRDLRGKFIDRMTWKYCYDRYGNPMHIVKDQGNAIYTTRFKIRFYR